MADTDERILDRFELLAEEGRFQYDSDCVRVMELARIGLSYSGKPNNSADHPERVLDMVATPPAEAALADVTEMIIRDVCESDVASPDNPDTICINVYDLTQIVSRHVAALRARPQAVAEGYALVDVSLIDDEWMAAAMRDAGIVRAVGAPPETIIRAAISGYLLAASQSATGGVK